MQNRHLWVIVFGLGLTIAILSVLLIVLPAKAPVNTEVGHNTTPPPPVAVGIPDLLVVTSPLPNDVLKSPLMVKGRARGNWFFEASAPVKIYDSNGTELGVAPVHIEGSWMTTDFVNFSGMLEFKTPMTSTGKLVFQKDNPSGLPENEKQFEMLVRFK